MVGEGDSLEPHWGMQVLRPEPQSRGCQPGSGSVPRARWFPLTDVPTAPAGGREGHSRRKMAYSPQPQTTVAWEADGSWAESDLRAIKGPGWQTLLSIPGTAPCRWHGPPCSLFTAGRLRLSFASSLGVGVTSKNEFEENRRRSRHATVPSTHWPPVETLVFGVMFPEGLPFPLPLPTHLTRCWPIAPAGNKVAVSPQGTQPGGVIPSGQGLELGHPACGHSFLGGYCSVSISFLHTSTHLLCRQVPVGSRGTLCPLGAGKVGHWAEGC